MSALAKFLLACGCEVSGEDAVKGEQAEELLSRGVEIAFGNDRKDRVERRFYESQALIYTNAISEENETLKRARAMGKKVFRRAEFLKEMCRSFEAVTAIAGSHGKTTCTAMCAHVLKAAGVLFAAHIGGEDSSFGNFYMNGTDFFVTEACEYKKNVLEIEADNAVLLNIDKDHMECYEGEEDLLNTFRTYLNGAQTAFICADDEKCLSLGEKYSTFGLNNPRADYLATDVRAYGEKYSFSVKEYGKTLCRVRLKAAGRYNVYNALAALAAMRRYGFSETDICRGLEEFEAVKRRFEKIGSYQGAAFICDYAHHPREIAATISTAKIVCKGRLFAVFQPHTYSRTRLLMDEFVETLRGAENLLVYKTYPAREFFDEAGCAKTLANNVGNCLYAESVRELKSWVVSNVRSGDVVLFLGAGDIYYAAQYLLRELNK